MRLSGTVSNSETGKSAAAHFGGVISGDLETGTLTFLGLVEHVVVPGVGTVFTDIGRVIIDAEGSVVFESGPHHQFFAGDTAELCAALAEDAATDRLLTSHHEGGRLKTGRLSIAAST